MKLLENYLKIIGYNRQLINFNQFYLKFPLKNARSTAYLNLITKIRLHLPQVALSSDFICGFCGETTAEFEETLDLMRHVRYNCAYLFKYSTREKTKAHRQMADDVAQAVKEARLIQMVDVYREGARLRNQAMLGQVQLILVEGATKKGGDFVFGRNDANLKVIVESKFRGRHLEAGEFAAVEIEATNSQGLRGRVLEVTDLLAFHGT